MVQRGLVRAKLQVDLRDALATEPARDAEELSGAAAEQRSPAADARFLMQATFGPTRSSLAELRTMSYEQWVTRQLQMPVESHRAYYRERVNPAYYPDEQYVALRGTPCANGSRWHSHVFLKRDFNKVVVVDNTHIKVDGATRSGLQDQAWVGMKGFAGHLCSVTEGVDLRVELSQWKNCGGRLAFLPNPKVWFPPGIAADMSGHLVLAAVPGVAVMQTSPPGCALDQVDQDGGVVVAKAGQDFYLYDRRFRLLGNDIASPTADTRACVAATAANEQSCVPQTVPRGRTVPGLTLEVVKPQHFGRFISQGAGGEVVARFVDEQIYYPIANVWIGFPIEPGAHFAARWTGDLIIRKGGSYKLFLESDDSSQLFINGKLVSTCRGHMREAYGVAQLPAGSHKIVMEYFNAYAGQGLIFQWQGPDSGGLKEVVPPSALSTLGAGEAKAGCPVNCGSPGEVANDASKGHMFNMWQVLNQKLVDRLFDHRHSGIGSAFQLAKTTVWTTKALEAQDQLRQRMAWALSQILVVSVQGVGRDEMSEMWINYYDIFVRNAFGNFFDVLNEVTYSPVMGWYLTHASSSSFDWNGNMPNENYAREVMQLFTIGLFELNKDGSAKLDADGNKINTYSNRNIMSFAKVFTGFVNQGPRINSEFTIGNNYIDPMALHVPFHDVYPKWNMVVPQNCNLHSEYRVIRTNLALTNGEMMGVESPGQGPCTRFGVHHQLKFLGNLYGQGEAAFITNVGNLPEPTTIESYRSWNVSRCFNLFSHSDQQIGAQTLKCQEQGTGPKGAGGRVADALSKGSQPFATTSFSLAGSAVYAKGEVTRSEIVDKRGAQPFHDYDHWKDAIGNITAQRHGNAYAEAYADAFRESIELTNKLSRVMENTPLQTTFPTPTTRMAPDLMRNFEQIAKLIAARQGRGAERDLFFVSTSGWDLHGEMKEYLAKGFKAVDEALEALVGELKAQGVWENVVIASSSEFGRTLDSNGKGSDHAWAGQTFVLGGGIKGKRIFNKLPGSFAAGNDHDLGRGRLIPDYPWESVLVPIAEWLGVEANELGGAFPNLGNFNSSHIIKRSDLFRS